MKYGILTLDASLARASSLATRVIKFNSPIELPSVKIILASIMGANVAAKPLNDCAKFKRYTAFSGEPNKEAYGFCRRLLNS